MTWLSSTCRDRVLRPQSLCGPFGWCPGPEPGFKPVIPERRKTGNPDEAASARCSNRLPQQDDQRLGWGGGARLEHHLEFAAIVAFDDQKLGLALIEDRPRRSAI